MWEKEKKEEERRIGGIGGNHLRGEEERSTEKPVEIFWG